MKTEFFFIDRFSIDLSMLQCESAMTSKEQVTELENLRQELHAVKSKLNVAQKTVVDLSDELEHQIDASSRKLEEICTERENQLAVQVSLIKKLEAKIEQQNDIISQQNIAISKAVVIVQEEKPPQQEQDCDAQNFLDAQNEEDLKLLRKKLTDTEQEFSQAQWKISELNAEIEKLNEQQVRQKSNLRLKTEEANELRVLLESAQEQNAALTTELAEIRTLPNDPNRKGNSLFAEVADQRKILQNKILYLKKHYYELKMEHENCPRRIRELVNTQHYSERLYKECMGLIRQSEYGHLKALNEQNKDLNEQLDQAKRRIRYLENEMASNSHDWVNQLIVYNKGEMEKLQRQLRVYYIKHREAMDLYAHSSKETSMWRIEAQRLRMKALNINVSDIAELYMDKETQTTEENQNEENAESTGAHRSATGTTSHDPVGDGH
uniref:Uncharacterized protein n=1 Tax=Anopheles minimus TaxID=112268 RepID=A0A182W531_9DIPT